MPEDWRKTEKLEYLTQQKSIANIPWQELEPIESTSQWLTEGMRSEFATFLPMGSKEAKAASMIEPKTIFKSYSGGVKTNRDDWVYDFDRDELASKIQRMIESYNTDVDRWRRRGNSLVSVDNFVTYDDTRIKWSESLKQNLTRGNYARFDTVKIRHSLSRPFCKQFLFFDRLLIERVYQMPLIFPTQMVEAENVGIWLKIGTEWPMFSLMTNVIPDLLPQGGSQCFPLFTYAEDGSNRRENVTDWALAQFLAAYGDGVSKRDILHYVYAVLHHPAYRARYAENLKRELPRIPLAPTAAFAALVAAGARLAAIHTGYEQMPAYPLSQVMTGHPFTRRVTKMSLTRERDAIIYNDTLRLNGVPAECFAYRLGNRSALEWVIDQYQVTTDKRSGITSDPNRDDDEDYITRLVGQVITVSLETVQIVASLPDLGIPTEAVESITTA